MTDTLADFNAFRARMNDLILGAGNLTLTRFFALDNRAYEAGALGTKTKEMLGWSPRWCSGATTASRITSSAVTRKVSRGRSFSRSSRWGS